MNASVKTRAPLLAMLAAIALLAGASAPGLAQQQKGPLSAFNTDNKEPIQIKAESCELRDKEQTAICTGNVVVRKGDGTLKAPRLVIVYEKKGDAKITDLAAGDRSSIKTMEATGGIVVSQRDQVATGEKLFVDNTTNLATIEGNVVLNQGQNVLRGKKLVINMKTNNTQIIGGVDGFIIQQPGANKPAPGKSH